MIDACSMQISVQKIHIFFQLLSAYQFLRLTKPTERGWRTNDDELNVLPWTDWAFIHLWWRIRATRLVAASIPNRLIFIYFFQTFFMIIDCFRSVRWECVHFKVFLPHTDCPIRFSLLLIFIFFGKITLIFLETKKWEWTHILIYLEQDIQFQMLLCRAAATFHIRKKMSASRVLTSSSRTRTPSFHIYCLIYSSDVWKICVRAPSRHTIVMQTMNRQPSHTAHTDGETNENVRQMFMLLTQWFNT